MKFSCGNTYDGDWSNDKKNGKGIFTWVDGESYEGDFKNDFRHG